MRKFNKGFIQIPLLIVIAVSILTASIGIGIVLYKKGKLPLIDKSNVVTEIEKKKEELPVQPETQGESKIKEQVEEKLTPTQRVQNKPAAELIPTPISFPTLAPQTTSNTFSNSNPNIHSIIPLGDISGGSDIGKTQLLEIYNEFLQTPNLQYMNHSQQNDLLLQIMDAYLSRYKKELENELQQEKENLARLQEENAEQERLNQGIETKLAELRQTLENIQGQGVAMSVTEGRTQRAYQDWIKNNSAVYSAILGSRYINDLNAILRAYGL